MTINLLKRIVYPGCLHSLLNSLSSAVSPHDTTELFFKKPLMTSMLANIVENLQYHLSWFPRDFYHNWALSLKTLSHRLFDTYSLVFDLFFCLFLLDFFNFSPFSTHFPLSLHNHHIPTHTYISCTSVLTSTQSIYFISTTTNQSPTSLIPDFLQYHPDFPQCPPPLSNLFFKLHSEQWFKDWKLLDYFLMNLSKV